jgi:hypothetical protein
MLSNRVVKVFRSRFNTICFRNLRQNLVYQNNITTKISITNAKAPNMILFETPPSEPPVPGTASVPPAGGAGLQPLALK